MDRKRKKIPLDALGWPDGLKMCLPDYVKNLKKCYNYVNLQDFTLIGFRSWLKIWDLSILLKVCFDMRVIFAVIILF